jgi:hypothetical protein
MPCRFMSITLPLSVFFDTPEGVYVLGVVIFPGPPSHSVSLFLDRPVNLDKVFVAVVRFYSHSFLRFAVFSFFKRVCVLR